MTEPAILDKILKELKAAKKKHPRWPVHVVAQAAIVAEEAGELVREALNLKYESAVPDQEEDRIKNLEREAIHTAASAIRFIENLRKGSNGKE
jgi:hypothetical protein